MTEDPQHTSSEDMEQSTLPEESTIDAPENESAEMTKQQLAEAQAYHRQQLACDLADTLLDVVYLSAIALLVAIPLDRHLSGFSILSSDWLRLAAMFLIVIAGHLLVSFPLSAFSGHFLEHRYQMSRQSFARWLGRYLKRNALTIVFGLVMVQGLYGLIWFVGSYWWLAAAGTFFVVSIVLGQLMPVLILPLFYKIERLDDESLAERFAQLASGTGLSIKGVYRMEMSSETVKANAMLAGLGSTRRVILGDTLLEEFSEDEIAVVLAHEIGHHVHRHIYKMMVAGLVYSTLSFLLCDRLVVWWVESNSGEMQYDTLPIYTLPLLLLTITVFSQLLGPLQNGMSRHFERQADRYALRRTGLKREFRSAFLRLAKLNKADPNPPAWEVFLFHSHPPITERLKPAEES